MQLIGGLAMALLGASEMVVTQMMSDDESESGTQKLSCAWVSGGVCRCFFEAGGLLISEGSAC